MLFESCKHFVMLHQGCGRGFIIGIYDSCVYSTFDSNKVRNSDMPDFVASYHSSIAFTFWPHCTTMS
jgi:hypothetical protein